MDASIPRVSIVIPTYNAEKTIGPLLESLLNLEYPDFEIIVVNDGSTDRTRAIVETHPVQLINQTHRGASAARDAGLRIASGDIVAYVDSDVTVTRDWLRQLVEPFHDPSIGATTGRTIFLRNDTCTSWIRSLDIERRNARRKEYTRLANGPNSAFRKSVLLQAGGFNPGWYHAEDTEVSYRIWQQGHRIKYVPEAVVHHVPEEDWQQFFRKRYRDAKAFTRMLGRFPQTAILKDDFVSPMMKVQPPLFLVLVVSILALPFALFTTFWEPFVLFVGVVSVVAVALTLIDVAALVAASRRLSFAFKGFVLGIMRGFAWGLGLGVGGIRQAVRR